MRPFVDGNWRMFTKSVSGWQLFGSVLLCGEAAGQLLQVTPARALVILEQRVSLAAGEEVQK